MSPPRAMFLAISILLFVVSDCPLCGFVMTEEGKSGWMTRGTGDSDPFRPRRISRRLAPWLSMKQETAGPGGSMRPGDQSKHRSDYISGLGTLSLSQDISSCSEQGVQDAMLSSQSTSRSCQCYWVINLAARIQSGALGRLRQTPQHRYCGGNTCRTHA